MNALYDGPIIDACVNHTWSHQLELMEFMSPGWREYLGLPNTLPDGGGMINVAPSKSFVPPVSPGSRKPADKVTMSSYEAFAAQKIGDNVAQVVLSFDDAVLSRGFLNPYLSAEISRAANDWTCERWLPRDERLSSLMVVSTHVPDAAAEEIRRVGKNPGIVGVLLGSNALGQTFGHPVYHPIYAAAAEMDLPIVIKAGTEALPEIAANVSGAGEPATYAEFRALESHSLMTHITAMITQGVFSKYPSLRLLVIGGGTLWIAPYLWRFDAVSKGLRREIPWLVKLPSEYFYEHVRVALYPLDRAPSEGQLQGAYQALDRMQDIVCFASCQPNDDHVVPQDIAAQFGPGSLGSIMYGNAKALFRERSAMPAAAVRSQ